MAEKTNHNWIKTGEGGWVAQLLDGCMATQGKILAEFSEKDRKAGYGFACNFIVDGPGGGSFFLWFCESGLQPKPEDVPLRNVVYVKEDDLLDIVTPNLDDFGGVSGFMRIAEEQGAEAVIQKLQPRLHPRKAFANDKILIEGDKPDIDAEMWAKVFDKVLYEMAFPIVVRGLVNQATAQRRK